MKTTSKLVSLVEGLPLASVREGEGRFNAGNLSKNYDHEEYSSNPHPLDVAQDAAMRDAVPPGAAPAPAPAAQSSYDKLLDIEDTHPGVLAFLTVVSQIYNGGVQQLADNNKGAEIDAALDLLASVPGRASRTFAKLLRNSVTSIESYAADSKGRDDWGNQVEVDPDQYFGDGTVADTLEDYLYDSENGEAICAEVLAAVQSETPAPAAPAAV